MEKRFEPGQSAFERAFTNNHVDHISKIYKTLEKRFSSMSSQRTCVKLNGIRHLEP